jgi:hypothetical protein
MATTTIVGKLARMPLLVLLHDTFETFLSYDQEQSTIERAQQARRGSAGDAVE